MNARYKAVRGAADISTQAGSLETFELLARRAGESGGWQLSLRRGWFGAAREKRRGGSGGRRSRGWRLARVVGRRQTKSTTSNGNSAILIHSSSFQTSYKGTAPLPPALCSPLPTYVAHSPRSYFRATACL